MITGSCHCGKTTFRIDGRLPERVTRCTCTICTKRGVLHAYYTPGQFSVSAEGDRIYRWRGQLVDSHFCGRCGCATYNASPAIRNDGTWDGATRIIAINARLLDELALEDAPVSVVDGKNRV
jgi:hypothetical protein